MQIDSTTPDAVIRTTQLDHVRGLAAQLHRALSRFVREYQFRSRNEICCHGVTVSACYLLEVLSERGSLSMQEVAGRLRLEVSTVARLVDGLTRKHLVRRVRDNRDRRVVRVELTEGGARVHQKIAEDLLKREEELLASLPGGVREEVVRAVSVLLDRASPSARRNSAK